MAGSIQKTLEGECVCVWKQGRASLCRSRSVQRKKVGERGGRKGSQRIPPSHSTVPVGTSWVGTNWCEINFPVGYNDPERSHTSLDQWHRKGPVSVPHAESDYLVLDCLATTLAQWDKNSTLLKTQSARDICLWECGTSKNYCVCVCVCRTCSCCIVVTSISNGIRRGRSV